MQAPATCPSAHIHTYHPSAHTHQWHGEAGTAVLVDDWKQAYRISNMVLPSSWFSPEVPLMKRSKEADQGSKWVILVYPTATEVNL